MVLLRDSRQSHKAGPRRGGQIRWTNHRGPVSYPFAFLKKPPPTDPENFDGIMRVMLAWPDEKKGPFVLEARWVNERGRPVCAGLEICKGVVPEPDRVSFRRLNRAAPVAEIKGTDLREIPLATVIERLWEMQGERDATLVDYYGRVFDETF